MKYGIICGNSVLLETESNYLCLMNCEQMKR